MKKILKNYKSTIILIGGIILGTIVGLIFKEKAAILSPLGDIFINLMFVIIVPLVFLTISSSIIKMENPKRLGKIMIVIILVFLLMSLVAAFIGIGTTRAIKIIDSGNQSEIMNLLDTSITNTKKLNILERTANLLTVNDFYKILSKDSIIAIILFAIIFGFAVKKSKSRGDKVKEIILSLNDIVINMVNIIMHYARIGLGCYIA